MDSPAKLARSTHPCRAAGAEGVGTGVTAGVGNVPGARLADRVGVGVATTDADASEVPRVGDSLGGSLAEGRTPDVDDGAADGGIVPTLEAHPAINPMTSRTLSHVRNDPPSCRRSVSSVVETIARARMLR